MANLVSYDMSATLINMWKRRRNSFDAERDAFVRVCVTGIFSGKKKMYE